MKKYYETHFYYLSNLYVLSVFNTSNSDLENVNAWLKIKDTNKVNYQTNFFLLMVVRNNPPSVVDKIENLIFYQGNLNNIIPIKNNLFKDDDNVTLSYKDWFTTNSKVVSYSIPIYNQEKLTSIKIFFANSFIGNWFYEIIGTDLLNQIAVLQINIKVVSCAQVDWIRWNGPYQKDWTICTDGYKFMEDGTCLMIDTTNPFKNAKYLFPTLVVIFTVIISIVASFLNLPYELWTLVIYINQIMLISWLINYSVSSSMMSFLSILQITKLDLKFLDSVFNSRNAINSLFYTIQYTNMKSINFESGSVFANFFNCFIMSSIYLIICMLGFMIVRWEKKSDINILSKYIEIYFNLKIYASFFKLCFTFILVNCISELLNQITLDESLGDMLSYTMSDVMLFVLICIIIFCHKFKPNKSIFITENIIRHDRLNLLKLSIYAVIFILKDIQQFNSKLI